MKNEINKAKTILLSCFAIMLIVDIFIISMSQSFSGGVRLLVTVSIMYFVYIGHVWAKWTVSALSLVAGFYSIYVTKNIFDTGYSMSAIFMGVLGVFWLFFGMYLVKSQYLNQFLNIQKNNRLSTKKIVQEIDSPPG